MECLSNSPLESKKWIINSLYSSLSSSSWNWSISASKDRHEEDASSLEAATLWGNRWKCISTGGRSSRAKKPDTETSIQASLGSPTLPTLMVWPTSWNWVNKGLKLRIRWTALSCLSSLTNTSDLGTLLRPAKFTRLRWGFTYLLSTKAFEK